jgi:hypothetical protein
MAKCRLTPITVIFPGTEQIHPEELKNKINCDKTNIQ